MRFVQTITAREASRGFSALLDRVESDAEEFTVVRDGREVARIVPAEPHTVGRFLAVRAKRKPVDDAFAADATSANSLLVEPVRDPWSV